MAEPIVISGRRGSWWVVSQAIGKYGKKWKEIQLSGNGKFTHFGNPIMPPTEWKVQVWLGKVYSPPKAPKLNIIAGGKHG